MVFFVDREIGLYIAEYYNQIQYKHNPKDALNSEDLKKEDLKVVSEQNGFSYKLRKHI